MGRSRQSIAGTWLPFPESRGSGFGPLRTHSQLAESTVALFFPGQCCPPLSQAAARSALTTGPWSQVASRHALDPLVPERCSLDPLGLDFLQCFDPISAQQSAAQCAILLTGDC